MSGRMRGSSCSKPMRTCTVAFCRSAVGHDRDHVRRDLPVRIRIEHRLDLLAGVHAVDVALVDVDFDLERRHVDDRADAGAGEAAAGRHRRDHLARLRVLRDRDAAERRADRPCCRGRSAARATWRSATWTCCARRGDPRRQRVDLGLARRRPRPAPTTPSLSSCARRSQVELAPARAALRSRAAAALRRVELRLGERRAPARICASSSRASTWPFLTAMPSSTITSTTLPVIFDETVARRRAVT